MGTTTELLEGFAQLLADAGLAAWNPTGVYADDTLGIFMKLMPTSPDRAVTLTIVDTTDDPTMPLGAKMLQVRGRGAPGDPTDVDDILDPIFTALHGLTGVTFGSQTVIQCLRRISAPMGMDQSKRWERADQFYLDVDAPPSTLRPDRGAW
ncbi:hypothetical protein RR49_01160 [Microbacterium ginsengisoli]|mgnify:CR=1 FL=1|uniref:Tail terminator n=1 Tax=Microbacterium ginsengisoli TaxID=400772 RepID=A0A0F0LV85_9MICO|nr:minor capsid protein [Microbacterium ginsengisoli]KJL37048.1 hypothetical protein RR49_01160 [Microbacterium ginsengisoli]MBN9208140.1 hypothetical protein [Microbacterium ginsengisoli]